MKPLVRNSIFMAFFNIFGRASGFVRYALLVYFLSDEQYGLATFAISFGSLCRCFTDGGLDNLVSRDGARDYGKVPMFYVNAMFMKTVLAVIFCLGAYWYLSAIREKNLYELFIVYIALIGSMMTSFTGVIRSCFTAIERMEYVFYTNVPSRFISIALLFFALWFALPLEIAVACISLENVIWFVLLGAVSLRFFHLKQTGLSLTDMRYMFWESLPLMVYAFFNEFYLRLDVVMIEYFMTYADVAPYTYASALLDGVTLLLSSYFVAVYPTLSRLYISDFDAYRRLFRQSLIMLFMFTIPTSVLIGFWSDLWMNLIKDTGPISAHLLTILAINLNLSMLNTLLIIVFTSCNRQTMLVIFTALALLISFLSNCVMIPIYAQPGAAYASLFSQLSLFCIMSIAAKRMFALTYPWQKPLWLAGLSIVSALTAQWLPGLPMLIEPLVFTLILAGLVCVTGVITKEEWKKIQSAIRPKK